MADTSWQKQTANKPLFPDLLWSRPENRRQAGKLLIVGGNSFGFAAPAAAYSAAIRAGVGSVRVILPESTKKLLGKGILEAEFAPNTPSGGLSRQALSQLLENSGWADGVLLAGDFGRNSETAILLESFLQKYKGQVTIAQDAIDYFLSTDSAILNRPDAVAVINMGKLQKLAKNNGSTAAIRHAMSLLELTQVLTQWAPQANLITKHADNFIVSSEGQISITPSPREDNWQVELATYASVWWLQQPQSTFEAPTTAVYEFLVSHSELGL